MGRVRFRVRTKFPYRNVVSGSTKYVYRNMSYLAKSGQLKCLFWKPCVLLLKTV